MGVSLKKRLPWLHINLATAFLAAAVVALFEGIIAQLTILAVFLPVVAGQGGNAGAQSLAVVMRGIVMREIPKDKFFALVFKEGQIGAINGAVIGAVTALVAWIWNGNPFLGLVIGLGMLVNLILAGLSGASIPLIMKKIGIDPAQSSSIILTTVTDVAGFFSFLGIATLLAAVPAARLSDRVGRKPLIWAAWLVFLRVGAVMAMLPAFGERAVPTRVRLSDPDSQSRPESAQRWPASAPTVASGMPTLYWRPTFTATPMGLTLYRLARRWLLPWSATKRAS